MTVKDMIRVREFFDPQTSTLTYAVWDESSRDAVVIDPVWDYDAASSRTSTTSVEKVAAFLRAEKLKVHFILETHAHADHLSGSQVLKKQFPQAQIAIGSRITEVQKTFRDVYHLPADFSVDGSQFDRLLKDGETFSAGTLGVRVIPTPGHTPACVSYVIEDHVFTGDSLFMPDSGTGRCDFPGGSAARMYESVHGTLYALPDIYKVYVGHDYQPQGRELRFVSTIGEQKKQNIQLKEETSKNDYVSFREARDRALSAPKLLLPSLQVNIAAGRLPAPEADGRRFLKIPIK